MIVETPRGPAHVRTGDKRRAVVYVHGYGTNADKAFRRVAQLVPAGPTLIVPAAPSNREQAVAFPDLGELLAAAGVPRAQVLAAGHSGGYRTLSKWLQSPQLRQLALLDAAYGSTDKFAQWSKANGRALHVVGGDSTRAASRKLATTAGVRYLEGGSHQGVVQSSLPEIARAWTGSPWLWAAAMAAAGWFIFG